MKPKISNKQLLAIFNLLNGLKEFEQKGIGVVTNLIAMYNFNLPDSILLRYEKDYMSNGQRLYQFSIAQIDRDGVVKFIDEEFKTIFERYSFLGECKVFDINDENQFEKID